ncbi:MAG: beta-lactamase family protein [Bacteroidia bacterium]|nr:beta-lactamase family protein [Bacteroidia bacterium]
MKNQFIGMTITLLLLGMLFNSCSTSTYVGRWIKWNSSGIDDFKHFPNYSYQASPIPFYFEKNDIEDLDNLTIPKNDKRANKLIDLLNNSKTTAFLIIRNDTILYERYLNNYQRNSMNTSFSVAKSITSLMIGKALDDKLIHSRDDKLTKYLPQMIKIDRNYENVSIAHILDMRSGIQFKDHDLIWGDKPKAYYHPNLRKRIEQLRVKSKPGKNFKYNPYNTIIAGMVIEKTSDLLAAEYFEQNIWNRLGMEYSGSWSLDSKESKMTKMESGLNLRAIDFAKFGRLILNHGKWNDQQIISAEWMNDCFKIDKSLKLDEYGGDIYYKNFWWIYSKDGRMVDIISGWGHLGQYLYIFPDSNTIIVRMGKKQKGVESWGNLFKTINEKINSSLN